MLLGKRLQFLLRNHYDFSESLHMIIPLPGVKITLGHQT